MGIDLKLMGQRIREARRMSIPHEIAHLNRSN